MVKLLLCAGSVIWLIPRTSIASIEAALAFGAMVKREVSFSLSPVCKEVRARALEPLPSLLNSAVIPKLEELTRPANLVRMSRLFSFRLTLY